MISLTEAQEQEIVINWAGVQSVKYPELKMLFHIPNGGSRHKAEAANLRRQGVKPGVPDLCLPVAKGEYHGLFIEMKRRSKPARLSESQKEWIGALKDQKYMCRVCYGADEAIDTIKKYLLL